MKKRHLVVAFFVSGENEMKLYGIANCDTVRKARKLLEAKGVEFEFVNTKKTPLSKEQLVSWVKDDGFDVVINLKSRTWKQLDEQVKGQIESGDYSMIEKNPSLLKRPVLESEGNRYYGFEMIQSFIV